VSARRTLWISHASARRSAHRSIAGATFLRTDPRTWVRGSARPLSCPSPSSSPIPQSRLHFRHRQRQSIDHTRVVGTSTASSTLVNARSDQIELASLIPAITARHAAAAQSQHGQLADVSSDGNGRPRPPQSRRAPARTDRDRRASRRRSAKSTGAACRRLVRRQAVATPAPITPGSAHRDLDRCAPHRRSANVNTGGSPTSRPAAAVPTPPQSRRAPARRDHDHRVSRRRSIKVNAAGLPTSRATAGGRHARPNHTGLLRARSRSPRATPAQRRSQRGRLADVSPEGGGPPRPRPITPSSPARGDRDRRAPQRHSAEVNTSAVPTVSPEAADVTPAATTPSS
jgi:hypothetical protein